MNKNIFSIILSVIVILLLSNLGSIEAFRQSQFVKVELPRTGIFARWPFFGGFRNILRHVRPNVHVGRKSDYRSEVDENYVNYHGAQLWKLMFDTRNSNRTKTVRAQEIKTFVQKFGKC